MSNFSLEALMSRRDLERALPMLNAAAVEPDRAQARRATALAAMFARSTLSLLLTGHAALCASALDVVEAVAKDADGTMSLMDVRIATVNARDACDAGRRDPGYAMERAARCVFHAVSAAASAVNNDSWSWKDSMLDAHDAGMWALAAVDAARIESLPFTGTLPTADDVRAVMGAPDTRIGDHR